MHAVSCSRPRAKGRLLPIVAAGILAVAVLPVPAQSIGGRAVSFGTNVKLSGLPSDPAGTDHWETSIAASPTDPMNLVALFMYLPPTVVAHRPCFFTASHDGGATWSVSAEAPMRSIPDLNAAGDPSVTADEQGAFYLAYIDANYSPTGTNDYNIRVARSTDGGQTFPTSSFAFDQGSADFIDKPYIAADVQLNSPFKGSLYVAYINLVPEDTVQVVVSRDRASTWSAPVSLPETRLFNQPFLETGLPVVAPDGTVYVFWSRYAYSGSMSIRFSRSTDGGVNWSTAADVAANLPSPGSFYLKNADKQFGMVADRGLNANGFPTAAITPDGSIFVAWTDFPKGSCKQLPKLGPVPPCSNSDVRLSVSHDGGATWTAPVKATDDKGSADQFFPWLAAHPDGLVSLSWIDRRLDSHNIDYDLFYTNTYDGVSFLPNVRVTSATSILGLTTQIGDYNGMAATAGAVFPAWGDLRNSTDVQVFSAPGTLAP